MTPLSVAILGATGTVGQRFCEMLDGHPWFRVERLFASQRSAGIPYAEAVNWLAEAPIPASVANLEVELATPESLARLGQEGVRIAFSALDAKFAGQLEESCAAGGAAVFSNASSHRMGPGVPLVVPEVNGDHLSLLKSQTWGTSSSAPAASCGSIVTNPNCSTIGLTLALAPLLRGFGLRRIQLVSLQALSGAGFVDGEPLTLGDNIVPFVPSEEDKLRTESLKILGTLNSGVKPSIEPAALTVSATCTRVPVTHGHSLCVSLELEQAASAADLLKTWRSYKARPQELDLPTAPTPLVHVLEEDNSPQPAEHRDLGRGMAISVGRLRPDDIYGESLDQVRRRCWKFVTLSHNLVRGAAGGSILNAELAYADGLLD